MSGFGFDSLEAILINLPTGVLGTAFQILLSIPSMRLKGYRCAIIVGANLIPLVCTALLWQLPRDNKQGLLASYLCFWTYFTPYVLSTSLPMANVSGHTKKITMNALWFIAYSLGNIIGMYDPGKGCVDPPTKTSCQVRKPSLQTTLPLIREGLLAFSSLFASPPSPLASTAFSVAGRMPGVIARLSVAILSKRLRTRPLLTAPTRRSLPSDILISLGTSMTRGG